MVVRDTFSLKLIPLNNENNFFEKQLVDLIGVNWLTNMSM